LQSSRYCLKGYGDAFEGYKHASKGYEDGSKPYEDRVKEKLKFILELISNDWNHYYYSLIISYLEAIFSKWLVFLIKALTCYK